MIILDENGLPFRSVPFRSLPLVPLLSSVTISPSFGPIGTTFTALFGGDAVSAVITYQWELNGTPIGGATSASYQAANVGDLTCVVTATNDTGASSLESAIAVVISPDRFGIRTDGTNLDVQSHPMSVQTYHSGDFMLLTAAIADGAKVISFPAETGNGEAIVPIVLNHTVASSGITMSAAFFVGAGTVGDTTISVTIDGIPDQFATASTRFPAASYPAQLPIDSFASGGTGTPGTSTNGPSWAGTNASADVLLYVFADGSSPSGVGAGWTIKRNTDFGEVAMLVAKREATTSAAETIGAVTVSFAAAETWSGLGIAVNATGASTLTRAPDCILLPVQSVASGTIGEVGNQLTVSVGTWIGSASATEYRWLKDGVVIGGQTASTYTPVSGDANAVITPQVRRENTVGFSAWASANNPVTIVSSANAPFIGTLTNQSYTEDSGNQTYNVGALTTGTAPITYGIVPVVRNASIQDNANNTYTVTGNAAGIPSPTISYQWKVGGVNDGTNSDTFNNVTEAATGNLTCVVTATNTHGVGSLTTAAVAITSGGGGAVTAWKAPGTVTQNASGTDAWTNLTTARLAAVDASVASATALNGSTGDISHHIIATNFTLTSDVPSGATILGVEVRLSGFGSFHANRFVELATCRLTKDGTTVVGLNRPYTTPVDVAAVEIIRGSSSDTWGTTLSRTEVIASTFGVMLQMSRGADTTANTTSALLDALALRVHYSV